MHYARVSRESPICKSKSSRMLLDFPAKMAKRVNYTYQEYMIINTVYEVFNAYTMYIRTCISMNFSHAYPLQKLLMKKSKVIFH